MWMGTKACPTRSAPSRPSWDSWSTRHHWRRRRSAPIEWFLQENEMMARRSLLLLSLVLVLSGPWPLQGMVAAQDLSATPDLSTVTSSPNDCEFLLHGEDDPRPRLGDIACGTLDVPENWSHPEGRRIQIAYLILKSTSAQPMPDPVVFLAGGPGSSPLTLAEVRAPFFAGLRQERDVIFFDQRGTRLSSPLRCEDYTRAMALEVPPPAEASVGDGTSTYPSDLTDADQLLQEAVTTYGPVADA